MATVLGLGLRLSTTTIRVMACAALVAALATTSRAQPVDQPNPVTADDVAKIPTPTPQPPADTDLGLIRPPVNWSEWEVTGELLDDPATVRAVLEPEMVGRRSLTESARADIRLVAQRLGYHLFEITTANIPGGGIKATLALAPMPIIRSVDIDMHQSMFDVVLDDQVLRRLQLGPGTYLPFVEDEQQAALDKETRRIEEFLRDEGFFDARAELKVVASTRGSVRLKIDIHLGAPYYVGEIFVDSGDGVAVAESEVRAKFLHRTCIVWRLCWGNWHFTRNQLRQDLEAVAALYQQRGYPSVRVQSDFEPATSIDRRTKTVRFRVLIDQRRQLDVVFEGGDFDRFPDETLRKQLTFNAAGSADDLEASDSAAAIAAYYQSRGRFDTQVSWTRERFDTFDRLVFRIDEGSSRRVRGIEIRGNHAVDTATLRRAIVTKLGGDGGLLGGETYATSAQLQADLERITAVYQARGYLEASVTVRAGPSPRATTSVAFGGALVLAERDTDDLYIGFDINEGQRSTIATIAIRRSGALSGTPEEARKRCVTALMRVAKSLGARLGPVADEGNGCKAVPSDLPLVQSKLQPASDAIRDLLWSLGFPNATVAPSVNREGPLAHHALFEIQVDEGPALTVGKVVVRGNFRTRDSIVLGQLGFTEGAPLTAALLARGPNALRATGLFDAVTLEVVSGEAAAIGAANFVIRVRERYDRRVQIDLEGGYSTQNGKFGRVEFGLPNLFGVGLSANLTLTGGDKYSAIEGSARIPRWLVRRVLPLGFDTDVLGFYRQQDTDRFGPLLTKGISVAVSRTFERARTERRLARLVTTTLRYDYRLRNREEDPLRASGPDADLPPVPVQTRTGSIGFNLRWDQRYDRSGNLNPLAPERGFILEGDIALASPVLFGQDIFVKLSGNAKYYRPLSRRLTLRTELRVDQGIPLGGAVLLPEVERFFGGGDITVRGYEEDRLATEIIEVGVPPIAGISQIKVVPRGGNIRAVASVDLQLALFSGWSWGNVATAIFVDGGFVRNQWAGLELTDVRPSVGVAPIRVISPIGTIAFEYAFPLDPQLGDNPRGRWHIGIAMRL